MMCRALCLIALISIGVPSLAGSILRDRLGCDAQLENLDAQRATLFGLLEVAAERVQSADAKKIELLKHRFGSLEAVDHILDVLSVEVLNRSALKKSSEDLGLSSRVGAVCREILILTSPWS